VRTLLILIFCSFGCNNAPAESPIPGQLDATGEVITTVNGKPITQGMIDATLALLPDHIQKQIAATGQQDQLTEQMVLGELLYQEALKRDLHKDPNVQTTIALSAREALAQSLLEKVIDERATEEVMEKWYQDHLVQFTQSEVDVSHILVDTADKALIEKLKKQLDGGADFGALAKKFSKDPGSKDKAGKLGKISRGRTVPPFEKAAFSTPKGKISEPVQTQFGWHLILVHDKISNQQPLSEVKEQVKQGVSKELMQAYFEELKSGATITEAKKSEASEATAEGKSKGKAMGKALSPEMIKKLQEQMKKAKAKGKSKKGKGKKAKGKKAKGKKAKGKAKE